MNRKIQTSCGKRKFYHQNDNKSLITQNHIIRPPTSHPYSGLNHYRSSAKLRNKYDSNYFTGKIFADRKNQNHTEIPNHIQKAAQRFKAQEYQNVPKIFKLLFTQLKVLLKNYIIQEDQFKQVLRTLTKKVRQIHLDNEQMRQKLNLKTKQLQLSMSTVQNLNNKIKQLTQHHHNINQSKHNNFLSTNSSQIQDKKNQFSLILQNLHLSQINESYLNTIQQLKSQIISPSFQIKKQNRDSQSATQFLRFHNRINYLEMKVVNSQKIQNQLTQSNQSHLKQIDALKKQIQSLKEQIIQIKQEKLQWRQRALMQKQDSQTNLTRQNFLLFSIKKLRQTNKNLTDKLLNFGNEDGSKKVKQLQPNPYFQYEVDFFKSLKSVYFQAKLKQYKISLQSKKDSFQIQAIGLQQQYLEYRKHQQVNLVALSYYRPTFYSFIEQCITNDIYSCRVKGSTSVSRIFIQVLRSIFNCKINEFFMSQNQLKYSRFPEYVYSWFQKYYFNSQKNQISALEPYMQKPISQDIFYRDLMNVKLDQSWQIITFRQFLLEHLSLEELYFYLMCQNLLYKKSGITQQIQYLGEFSIFVQFSNAKIVLDLVLSDFQSWNIAFLTSKLRQKIVIKKNVQFIESGFFLRCLIQYYKIQRINRFKYISKLSDEFKSCQQNGLRFSSFISVINRFTQISSEEKIRLYRDCYSVSKGKITADVIFTVCSEQLVFLRYLKIKCFYRLPVIFPQKQLSKGKKKSEQEPINNNKILCLQPSQQYIYDIFTGLNKLLNDQKCFTKRIQKLGVSELSSHFEMIKRLFGQKSNSNDSSILKFKHFIHFISNTMNKIRQISFRNFYDLLDENNKRKSHSSFWIEMDELQLCRIFAEEFKVTFEVFDKINNYRIWKQNVYKFRVNCAARKIQKQVRKKFIQPFMQLYKIIYSQIKKDETLPLNGEIEK